MPSNGNPAFTQEKNLKSEVNPPPQSRRKHGTVDGGHNLVWRTGTGNADLTLHHGWALTVQVVLSGLRASLVAIAALVPI
jgi:hypothetical protein